MELTVPAALTFAESSARIPSGPPGADIVTLGGAVSLYPDPPLVTLMLRTVLSGAVTIPVAPPTSL